MYYYIFVGHQQNTGKAINNTYLHSQPSQAHALNPQNEVIISKMAVMTKKFFFLENDSK